MYSDSSFLQYGLLSWYFMYDSIFMHIRSSSNFRQFLQEFCLFWNLNYWKYADIRTSVLHALIYTELKFRIWLCYHARQIKFEYRHFPSILVGVIPHLELLKILEIRRFSRFSSASLTHWSEILYITFFMYLIASQRLLVSHWNLKGYQLSMQWYQLETLSDITLKI